ncbi:MAG: radical SAM protein [Fimbriimonas sp.]|nr:radical SAM protein [Fimbriimonas sp.]
MVTQLPLFEEFAEPVIPATLGLVQVGIRERASVLNRAGGDYLGCDYTLNPYVGCGFGCSYCYAAFYVPDLEKRAAWGTWVDLKVDAERQIAQADLKGKKIFMSSATDPYQPIEAKVCLTRRLVELMSDPSRQPILRVQTRSPIAARDIDLFRRFEDIRVNMSITTDCDEIRKRFEPGCASIERRIEAIAAIADAGIPVGLSISPMLPMRDPEAFGKRLAGLGAKVSFTAMFHQAKQDFQANTRPLALELAAEYGWDERRYRLAAIALKRHLPHLHIGDR